MSLSFRSYLQQMKSKGSGGLPNKGNSLPNTNPYGNPTQVPVKKISFNREKPAQINNQMEKKVEIKEDEKDDGDPPLPNEKKLEQKSELNKRNPPKKSLPDIKILKQDGGLTSNTKTKQLRDDLDKRENDEDDETDEEKLARFEKEITDNDTKGTEMTKQFIKDKTGTDVKNDDDFKQALVSLTTEQNEELQAKFAPLEERFKAIIKKRDEVKASVKAKAIKARAAIAIAAATAKAKARSPQLQKQQSPKGTSGLIIDVLKRKSGANSSASVSPEPEQKEQQETKQVVHGYELTPKQAAIYNQSKVEIEDALKTIKSTDKTNDEKKTVLKALKQDSLRIVKKLIGASSTGKKKAHDIAEIMDFTVIQLGPKPPEKKPVTPEEKEIEVL